MKKRKCVQVRLLFRLELEQTALGSCVSSMVLKLWIIGG